MNNSAALDGLEPVSRATPQEVKEEAAVDGASIHIDGESYVVSRVPQPRHRMLRWLSILGPGLIATSAGNDAGGITTYTATGAQYGYDLIWVMILITLPLALVQEMCTRLGAATGRGMLDLIRERFGLGWALFAIAVVLIANGALVVCEFVGFGAAAELLGIPKLIAVPLAALGLWYVVLYCTYARVEKVLLLMTLVFFVYPVAAVMAKPDWGAVAHGAFVPTIHRDSGFIMMLVALIGTTITPYMQLFQQSSIVERGVVRKEYGPERVDAYVGSFLSNLMSISMIVAAAATLHAAGQTRMEEAADAAKALEPVLGAAAKTMFAVGLMGATLLAAAVLPLATAYAVSEAFGFPKGVNLDFRRAPMFFTLFSVLLAVGAVVALLPGIPMVHLMLAVQVLNGILLPIVLVFILLLANDRDLMGKLQNKRYHNLLGWTTVVAVTAAVLILFGSELLG